MNTTTVIAIICILAITGIALLATGVVRICQRSKIDTFSYRLIAIGSIFIFAIAIIVSYFFWRSLSERLIPV